MRTMMKISIPIEAANRAVKEDSVKPLLRNAFETLKPEAAYFYPSEEGRIIMLYFDLKETSDLPGIGEPFFQTLNARITFTPVMNMQDFQVGLAKVGH